MWDDWEAGGTRVPLPPPSGTWSVQAGDSYVGWQLVCLPNSGARLLEILPLGLGQPGAGPGIGRKATPGGQKGCWVGGSCEGVICVGWVPPQS